MTSNCDGKPVVADAGAWVLGRPGRYRQDGERVFDSLDAISYIHRWQMIDIMQMKLTVIKAACGITALSEVDLLQRLEELYLQGYKQALDDSHVPAPERVITPRDAAQILCDNSPRCDEHCEHGVQDNG